MPRPTHSQDPTIIARFRAGLPILVLVSLLFGLLTSGTTNAADASSDRILERAYLLDSGHQLNIQNVPRAEFTVYHGVFSRYNPATYWIRLRLGAPTAGAIVRNALWLHIQQRNGLTVEYFQPEGSTDCQASPGPGPWPSPASELSPTGWFKLPLCAEAKTVYLKIHAKAEPTLRITASPYSEAVRRELIEAGAVWLVAGAMLLAMLLATARGLTQKDVVAWAFLLQQVTLALYLLAQWEHPPSESLRSLHDWLNEVPLQTWRSLMLSGPLLFALSLANKIHPAKWRTKVLLTIALGSVAATILSLSALREIAASVSGILFLVGLPSSLFAIWKASPKSDKSASKRYRHWGAALARAGLLVLAWLTCLSVYIWFDPPVLAGYLLAFHALLGVITVLEISRQSKQEAAQATAERIGREHAESEARQEQQRRDEARELLMMLTHELRTPLSVLRLSLDQSLVPAGNTPAVNRLKQDAIADMDGLIERCLQTADLDDPEQLETIGAWDSATELAQLASQWQRITRVTVELASTVPTARSRPAVTRMILNVLVDNARKYGAENAPITIGAAPQPRDGRAGVLLTVTNVVGPSGLPNRDRLFSKYYRAPTAHSHVGAGLGLYLAYRLTERMDAALSYHPLEDSTCFSLWLPC